MQSAECNFWVLTTETLRMLFDFLHALQTLHAAVAAILPVFVFHPAERYN